MASHFWFIFLFFISVCSAQAGPYLDSAHGDFTNGVSRPSMSGYAIGNCGHCHEQHGSVAGVEPAPDDGGPSPYTLFSINFDTTAVLTPYNEADNLCFKCHYELGSIQSTNNNDFTETFGCGTPNVISILGAFNQTSYHNLNDIYNFANPVFSWMSTSSNPCSACHNSHRAKRNNANPADPTYTSISKPSDHENLFGDDTSPTNERMSVFFPSYLAPYCNVSVLGPNTSEPAGAGAGDGSDMPDYVSFCTDCHDTGNVIETSSIFNMGNVGAGLIAPPRNLLMIDVASEVHGGATNSGAFLLAPYTSLASYKLSCVDCHEPHGSSNILLIRRWVNGGSENTGTANDNLLAVTVSGASTNSGDTEWATLCGRCHGDKVTIGISHHGGDLSAFCGTCHPGGAYAPCTDCHYHGSTFTYGAFVNQPIF